MNTSCKYFYEWDNRYPKCKLKDIGINRDTSLYCNYPNCGSLLEACRHQKTSEEHYIDYDRNMYREICTDCKSILFDGNAFEYEKYKKGGVQSV